MAPRLDGLTWKSAVMARLATLWPALRLPLPADFLTGFDICMAHERGRAWSVLILGRSFPDGVWWYFAVSWLLKTPLALLLALGIGLAGARRAGRAADPAFVGLLLNLGLHLAYFSFLFRAQIGYRYVLMAVPLVTLLAAAGWAARPLARARLAAAAALALVAGIETAPYLGNSLAFTNALVQPKREAWRFLTNSSLDWGQNDEKVAAWVAARRFAPVHVEPTHLRPGVNVIGLNVWAGAGQARQHAWLRANLRPAGHFRHTVLWVTLDEAGYQRFLDEDRRLAPDPADTALCADDRTLGPIDVRDAGRFPESKEPSPVWILCVRASARVDLGFFVDAGGPLFGRPWWLPRDWDRLRPGEQAWYRLEPGLHALAVTRLGQYSGRFELRGGAATLRLRPARLRKGRPLEPL
jgi:hypothetical protein